MSSLSKELTLLIHQVGRCLQHQSPEWRGEIDSLTLLQMQALLFIKEKEPVTMGELATRLDVSAASTTALVDRLIASGWLQRDHGSEDRRTVTLRLPEEKKAHFNEVIQQKTQRIEQLLNQLSAEDQAELLRILNNLLTIINQSK